MYMSHPDRRAKSLALITHNNTPETRPTIKLFDNTYSVNVTNPNSPERQIKLIPLSTDRHCGLCAHPTIDTSLFIVSGPNSYGMDVFTLDKDGKTYKHTVKDHSLPFNPIGADFMTDNYCIIYGQPNRASNLLHVKFDKKENEYPMSIINKNANRQYLGHCPSSNYFICTEKDRYNECFYTIAHDGSVLKKINNFAACKVAFSSDGQYFMVISNVQQGPSSGKPRREVYLASINLDQKNVNTIARQYLFESSCTHIALSPDGKLFLVSKQTHCGVHDSHTMTHLKNLYTNNPCLFGPTSRFFNHNIYSVVDQETKQQYENFPKNMSFPENMPEEMIELTTKLFQPEFLQYLPRFVLLLSVVNHIKSSGNLC